MFKRKLVAMLAAVTLVSAMAVGCSSKTEAGSDTTTGGDTTAKEVTVSVSGSTSVGPLAEKEAEEFSAKYSNITIEVNQSGSSAGIKDASAGTSEIGMSSRELKEEEKSLGLEAVEIALDGVAVVTHPSNTVKDLTPEQIKDIFTGKITNWKEVGGADAPIVVVSREAGSGTRGAFEEIVGYKAEELIADATIANATGAVKETVAGNENAIGYMSLGYLDEKVGAVTVEGVEAKAENVKNGTYKIQRPFLLVYKEDVISEEGKQFIDFILSEDGQKIVEEDKLVSIK